MESSLGDRLGATRGGTRGSGGSFGTKVGRLVFIAAGLIVLLILLPSTVTYINPGHVGIVIHRAGGGVDPTPLGPGFIRGTRCSAGSRSIRCSCRRSC